MIRAARKAKGLSQAQLAGKINVVQSVISEIETGRKNLTWNTGPALSKALDIPLDVLAEVIPGDRVADSAPPLYGAPAPHPLAVRILYSKKFEEPQLPQARETEYLPVPIVESKVAAGAPEVVKTEEVIDIAFIHRRALGRRSVAGYICTFVTGDSMYPLLRDGSIVCIDTKARPAGRKVPRDSVWAVRKGDGAVIKHLQFGDGMIVLLSANPAYPPEIVQDPEAIIGRVVWAWVSL